MHFKKGDTVQIISGKDKGKSGTILQVLADAERIVVKDVNLVKKRTRPTKQGEKGQTVELARSLAASNAMLVCKNCKKATRVGFRTEGGQKIRYCKKCEASN